MGFNNMETKKQYDFKSIGIYPETYEDLKKEGHMHESFNDVLKRILPELRMLRELYTVRTVTK